MRSDRLRLGLLKPDEVISMTGSLQLPVINKTTLGVQWKHSYGIHLWVDPMDRSADPSPPSINLLTKG